MIRVLLVEDHALVRAGLSELIDNVPDMQIVGAAADGEQAIALAASVAPDVVLMDLSMPGMEGIEATRRILSVTPAARVVILTSFGDRDRIMGALDAGAVGYMLKDVEPDELFGGIRAAASGLSPLTPQVTRTLFEAHAAGNENPAAGLTRRELDVLALVARGMSNKLVASHLDISEQTVKTHMTGIFRALGVSDRTQAALWAVQHGIVAV